METQVFGSEDFSNLGFFLALSDYQYCDTKDDLMKWSKRVVYKTTRFWDLAAGGYGELKIWVDEKVSK